MIQMDKTLHEILIENNLCLTTNPRGTDKGSYKSYIDKFYSREFPQYREKQTSLMEIGFRHGASLALWSYYFTNSQILGLDNHSDLSVTDESPIVDEWVNKPNIRTKIGDAYDKSFANEIEEKFDIIIDDGPHWISTQQMALKLYLPKLNTDGIFVVEDILRGGLAILPLLKAVPLGYKAYFYAFGKSADDCIFAVRPNSNRISSLINHIGLAFSVLSHILPWLMNKISKLVLKK